MYLELALFASFAFVYSVLAGRVERFPVSGPIVFVLIGVLVGPLGFGWVSADLQRVEFRSLIDLTLALILFIDAAHADTSVLRRYIRIPARMLLLGLPGAIVLGSLLALAMFDGLGGYEVALLATMLAATDAALGKAVVTDPRVPVRLREGLNCESGLNDGLCVPILLVFIALAKGEASRGEGLALHLLAAELGIGALVGLVVAGLGALLLRMAHRRDWISEVWIQISVPALAISAFALAQSMHGSGYIASFVGGMLFGLLAGESTHKLAKPGEGISETLAMLTWLLFGMAVVARVLPHLTWSILGYSLLSLTVVRVLPVYLSLAWLGESARARLFLGWFGPRGLASVVFAIIVLGEGLPGAPFIAAVVACTVGLSLLAHGLSAGPMAAWIGRHDVGAETHADNEGVMDRTGV